MYSACRIVVLVFACEKGCFGGEGLEGFLVPEGRGRSLVVVCGDMVCLLVVLVPTYSPAVFHHAICTYVS